MKVEIIDLNNQGCNYLEGGYTELAVTSFRSLLSQIRASVETEINQKDLYEGTKLGAFSSDYVDLLPLPRVDAHVVAERCSTATAPSPFQSASSQQQGEDHATECGCSIYRIPFRMTPGILFSYNRSINLQCYVAIAIFNLAMSLHIAGQQQHKGGSKLASSSSSLRFRQASILYGQTFTILKGCICSKRLVRQAHPLGPFGNELIDLLLLALLNNLAIVSCVECPSLHTTDSPDIMVTHKTRNTRSDFARNLSLVRSLAQHTAMLQVRARASTQPSRSMSLLTPSQLAVFERNALCLWNVIVLRTPDSAAPAA